MNNDMNSSYFNIYDTAWHTTETVTQYFVIKTDKIIESKIDI